MNQRRTKCSNEYDGYNGKLYELLASHLRRFAVDKYLFGVTHDRIGFDSATEIDMQETPEYFKKILLAPE